MSAATRKPKFALPLPRGCVGEINRAAHEVSVNDAVFKKAWELWKKQNPQCVLDGKARLTSQQLNQLCAYFYGMGMAGAAWALRLRN